MNLPASAGSGYVSINPMGPDLSLSQYWADNANNIHRFSGASHAVQKINDNDISLKLKVFASIPHIKLYINPHRIQAVDLIFNVVNLGYSVGKWLFLGDVVAVFLAFIFGGMATWLINVYIKNTGFQGFFSHTTLEQFAIFVGVGLVALLWLDMKGHYRQRLPFWEVVGNNLKVVLAGLVFGGFVQFAIKGSYSRLWFGLSWILFAIFLHFSRIVMRSLLNRFGRWKIPAVVVGDGPTAQSALRALKTEPQMGYDIVATVPAEMLTGLRKPSDWRRFMRSFNASYLFLALEGGDLEQHKASIRAMTRERLPYSILPPWLGLPLCGLTTHNFMMHDVLLMQDTNRLTLPLPRILKRTFDVVVAGTALVALSPLFAVIAVLVRRDGGKAFFRQARVGLKGNRFVCYKFRSMRSDAEAALQHYLENDVQAAAEWMKFQKLKNDPRITKIGKFIRATSIDELPQLINVVKGNMSLVGPRPIMPGQEIYYGDEFKLYKSARPGITGPWQVSGRNMLTIHQRVALEAWYVRNWSFWIDFVIMMKTFPALFSRNTAF